MLLPVLLVVSFHLSCGVGVGNGSGLDENYKPQSAVIDFRHYCTSQHFSNTYKVSCDGSKHFKSKELTLDKRSILGITEMELYSFDNVTINSYTPSDWYGIKKIIIRNCRQVCLDVQSVIMLKEFAVDSLYELTIKDGESGYSIIAEKILLSNIGKLNLPSSSNANINSTVLSLKKVTDINFAGQLKAKGELLTISQSNMDIMENAVLDLKFTSVTVKDSAKLYIQESGQLDVSTQLFCIQESYIYMDGKLNIVAQDFLANRKSVDFFNNSIYGLKRSGLAINGINKEVKFIGNGIYRSDIKDVMGLIREFEGVIFTNNRFGCNKCSDRQLFQEKYQQHFGEQNFCDLTCNLSLSMYISLMDKIDICNVDGHVDGQVLCNSDTSDLTLVESGILDSWFVVPVIIILFLSLLTLVYYFYKRHLPKFLPVPVENNVIPSPSQPTKVTARAFNNELYAQFKSDTDSNIYEVVDHNDL